MVTDTGSALILASEQLLTEIQNHYETEEDAGISVDLSAGQVSDLEQKILVLPDDDIAILLLHYALGFSYNDIAVFLKQGAIRGRIRYAEHLLSTGIGLPDTECISKDSMRSACKIALKSYTANEDDIICPRYSRKFTKTMRAIKAVRSPDFLIISVLQKVAIVFLALGISFGITLSVNAGLREKVYHWLIETFPQFSYFGVSTDMPSTETSFENLLLYKPAFVPDGYTEIAFDDFNPSVYYAYENREGTLLTIAGRLPDGDLIALNTEGVEVETMLFREEDAFYWVKDGISYFAFVVDDYYFTIMGPVDRDIMVQIAESIEIS